MLGDKVIDAGGTWILSETDEVVGAEQTLIDRAVNDKALRQPNIVKLSTDASRVAVYLIPTNEELVIARDTEALVKAAK